MTESTAFNALKHGAFSEVLILPGEDPAAFEELKQRLFVEYNVSGCSEESTMTSIAKTMWQLQRLRVYEHVQFLRAQGSNPTSANGWKFDNPIRKFMAERGMSDPDDSSANAPTEEAPPKEKTTDERLLELGDFVSLGHLDKELEVENKLMAKLDRLLKRFFQIKAMKPLMGLGEPLAPVIANTTPVLELIAAEAPTSPDHRGEATELGSAAADEVKPVQG